ncbi:secreted protein [Colletotrichum tofieldiae]|uniref:Secreted protein n=1 Tax=Colletotrichum tofieldiae TaxID=708197 RepID=A0A166U260_9PEZI|nr:secreted protein [Colletotrichum tofieldiae]GKT60911.1 secreted protein [Colletotrichum tofieldiae]GKT68608.1 secreted protein [Colletotrichum tofieldiae]GKT90363.1 secreted protein [Colletotrichum tofieldiae]
MKTTAVLASLTALMAVGIETASARCFQTGATYENKDTSKWHIQRACEGYDGRAGAFQGYYRPGEFKSACVTISGTQVIRMSVGNLNKNAGFDLADKDCTLRLQNEVNNCNRGSEHDVSGWRFRVDPNNERC